MQKAQMKLEKSPSRSSGFVMNRVLLRVLSLNYSTVRSNYLTVPLADCSFG